MERKVAEIFKYLVLELAGVLAFVVGWESFIVPNKVGVGGVAGICDMLGYLLNNKNLGSLLFLINLPLLVLGAIYLGKDFCFKTGFTVVVISFVSNLLGGVLPEFVGDKLVFCTMGALLMGLGMGLIFKSGGTSGGTEIIAKIVKQKRPDVEFKWVLFGTDALVICLSAVVYNDIFAAAYGSLVSLVYTTISDKLAYGTSIVLTVKPSAKNAQDVLKAIEGEAEVRVLCAKPEKLVLLTYKNRLHKLSKELKKADKSALIFYYSVKEVE